MRPPNSSRGPDGLKKGPWTPEEDQKLIDYIQTHGQGRWQSLPEKADLNRCGKSCRLRWTNYLRPDIKRGNFTPEEEQAIIDLHSVLGNKWSMIATRLPGRTDNEIKNFWNTHLRKRLLRSGIDPTTHQPITYPTLLASTDANCLMNGPLEDLAKIRILCNILQLLKANPLPTSSGGSELALNHFGGLVNGSASNPLQVPPMETVEPLWHKEFQPINFDTYGTMPKLVDSKNNGITSSASKSFTPEVLSGCNQVHSDIELAQLPSYKQAFASNSYDDVWGEVIDDEASGSCSWKDAFNELFLASAL